MVTTARIPAHALTGDARKIAKPSNFVKFRHIEDPSNGHIPLSHAGKSIKALWAASCPFRPVSGQKVDESDRYSTVPAQF